MRLVGGPLASTTWPVSRDKAGTVMRAGGERARRNGSGVPVLRVDNIAGGTPTPRRHLRVVAVHAAQRGAVAVVEAVAVPRPPGAQARLADVALKVLVVVARAAQRARLVRDLHRLLRSAGGRRWGGGGGGG